MLLDGYRFTETHEWVKVNEANGIARVGITDHAQEEITDVVFVDLPEAGSTVAKGGELMFVGSVKASFSIYAPISGRISAVNEALAEHPELVNGSPYEDGWMVEIEPSGLSELESLMDEDAYQSFLAREQ